MKAFVLATLWFAAAGAALPAAAATRIWVSGHGVDAAGCGAPTSPCRSLQFAHDNVAAGGEIDVLDPAGYGAVTISKAISIVNDGVGTAGVQAASGAAITINAGASDSVYLRGLNIDGANFAGQFGVQVNKAGQLVMVGCTVRHFQQLGIWIDPTSTLRFSITDTLTASNHDTGLYVTTAAGAQVIGSVERLTATGNVDGVTVASSSANGSVALALSDVNLSNNAGDGLFVSSTAANVAVTLAGGQVNVNGGDGLFVGGQAAAHISRSVFNQNSVNGVEDAAAPAGVFTTGDNTARGNGSHDVQGAVTTDAPF